MMCHSCGCIIVHNLPYYYIIHMADQDVCQTMHATGFVSWQRICVTIELCAFIHTTYEIARVVLCSYYNYIG